MQKSTVTKEHSYLYASGRLLRETITGGGTTETLDFRYDNIKDRKFPHWVHGAGPMGKNSPMEYLGQRKDGELVALRFRDVDTGEERIVEQFY